MRKHYFKRIALAVWCCLLLAAKGYGQESVIASFSSETNTSNELLTNSSQTCSYDDWSDFGPVFYQYPLQEINISGQSFTPTSRKRLSTIKFWILGTYNPGSFDIELYSSTKDTGFQHFLGKISGIQVSGNPSNQWFSVDVSSLKINVTPDSFYSFKLVPLSGLSLGIQYNWGSSSYAGGKWFYSRTRISSSDRCSSPLDQNWTTNSDLKFEVLGVPIPPPYIVTSGSTSFCSGSSVNLSVAPPNNALEFGGANYVNVNHSSSLSLDSAITAEFWIKGNTSANTVILEKGGGNSSYHFQTTNQSFNSGGRYIFFGVGSSSVKRVVTATEVIDGTWHHIAGTYDKTSQTLKIYVDGVLDNSKSVSSGPVNNSDPLQFGSRSGNFGFVGQIDEVRVWNTVRTESQISDAKNSILPANTSNIVAYYKMDEGSGTNLDDVSGNSNNGTLVNNPSWINPSTSPMNYPSITDYLWSPGGETTSSITVSTSGIYSVAVNYSTGGSGTSAAVSVTAFDIPTMNVVAFKDSSICSGASATLVAATGNGMNFSNANSFSIPYNGKFGFNNSMTVEAWIKTTTTGSSSYLISKESSFHVYLLQGAGNDGKVGVWLEGINSDWMKSKQVVNDGKWHHVAVTYDRKYTRLYIDGVLSSYEAHTAAISQSNSAIYLGSRGGSTAFVGSMDEVRFWNTARSAAEINANLHKVLSSGTSGLAAYYKLDEASGTTAADSSGNNNINATIGGTPSWMVPSKAPVAGNAFTSYSWSNSATGSSIIVSPSENTSYSVTATTAVGCTATDDQAVYVSGSSAVTPAVTLSSSDVDNSICSGSRVTFTALPSNEGSSPLYLWKLNGNQVGGDSAKYVTDTLKNNDLVQVELASSLACVTSSMSLIQGISTSVTANVTPSVTITSSDNDNAICSGTGVIFTATPTNGGTPSYQWKLNGVNVGGDSAKYVTDTLKNGDSVKVVMTSSEICVTSPTVQSNTITTSVTANVTPLVSVASSASVICPGTSVTFTATPTNGGTPSYQWKLNGNNVGTNSSTYTSSGLANGEEVKVVMTSSLSCVTSSTAESNTNTMIVVTNTGSNTLWLGNTSTSWSTASNWCGGSVPSSGASVTIPAGLTNYPVLGSDVSLAKLELATGSTLSLNGNKLTLTDTLSGTGRFIGSSTSSLEFSGSGTLGTLYFSTTTPGSTDALANLTYNRSGQTLTLGTTLNVYGVITPTAGTLNANGNLILKSNSSGTARIAEGSGNYITGEVTVERYLPATGRRYRLLTPTVNTTGSIRTNWMEGGLNTAIGSNNDPYPGYGTHITGVSGNVNGFDVTSSNQSSLYLATNGVTPTYTAVTGTGGTLNARTGYFLFVRGDRSVNMTLPNTNVPPTPVQLPTTATTLRTKGTLVTGTVSSFTNAMNSTAGALNLVTNPYASPIDWAAVQGASSNISEYYTLWDPTIGYRGGFVTVSTSGLRNDNTSSATRYIQPGQAFFVQATGGTPAGVVIKEEHKASGSNNNNGVFGPSVLPAASLQASVFYQEGTGYRRLSDGVLSQLDNSYSTGVDGGDALEITNWDENLAIIQEGKRLAIEKRKVPMVNDTLQLYMSNMKQMSYELEVNVQGMSGVSLQPYLVDRLTGAQTLLTNEGATVVPFTVTSNAQSSAWNRFYVVFRNAGALPVRIVQFKASAKDKGVQLAWQVEEDESVDHYEVERSKDQSAFHKIGMQMASGGNTLLASYQLLDNAPFTGHNFYRLKLVEKGGEVKYSKVERVTFTGKPWTVVVFPNPFSGTELQVKLSQWPAGNYRISLTDVLGRVVYNRYVETPGGEITMPIGLQGAISSRKANAGVYWLKIEGEGVVWKSVVLSR